MPLFPMNTSTSTYMRPHNCNRQTQESRPPIKPPASVQVKNRRKRYLDAHPEYFSAALELADPLLYDRLIRRFQTATEREEEGRAKGYSGVLEADLMRSEAKMEALANPDPSATVTYSRGPNGEILAEDQDEIPETKKEGAERWRWEMEMRFLRGADHEFDYNFVDQNEEYDDWNEEQERYFDEEEPHFLLDGDDESHRKEELKGETGIQDF
ncbi:DUF2052 superfamily domain-containing protein [Histoplasma capsulatum var. duboisii H88]|uniref:DUF2052 superfamily domain-containing protein n=1 Tax=Ajellomyces capsulatus (strain H88) TaxID=544711 RepID=A0A8A1LHB3_AJEC8|nr:DUF2052 superfamily domain-containing protein [Histoplasma capsulatum var. duboisii H88]